MSRPKLIVMCGLSASGKSTIAKELVIKHNACIVSSDSIREEICGDVADQSKNEEVFKIFHKRIREYLNKGQNVIADATNITMKSRRAIIKNVRKLDVEKICYIIPKKFKDCIRDNRNRKHPVPEEVIAAQISKFQIPFKEEGWEKIVIYDMDYTYADKFTPEAMSFSMIGFDQKNPHHNMYLDQHCDFVYNMFSSGQHPYNIYKNGFLMGVSLHDIGKLYTQSIDENSIAHYLRHENIGSYFVLTSLYLWKNFTDDDLLDCCFLINYHMMPFSWENEKTKNRWRERFGEYKYETLMRFHECDKTRLDGE